ncbi:MAG TPA: ChbG/HpnK family deacetylase [Planctomycetota bacterium]|nr:ChbG/HpnK family deacetylase [Planctomycetota bacterium]
MILLVVNADDAGFDRATDDAILRSSRIAKSASVAVNGPTAREFVLRAEGMALGVHINLTEGMAVAGPHATLTDAEGRFRWRKDEFWERARKGAIDPREVRREVRAQWERGEVLGIRATHVDGHNHVHVIPAVREALPRDVYVRVPLDRAPAPPFLHLPWAADARARRTDRFTGYRFAHEPTVEVFLASLEGLAGSVEFMVHPGAREGSAFVRSPDRDRETDVLSSPALADELVRRGVRVVSFADLPCA